MADSTVVINHIVGLFGTLPVAGDGNHKIPDESGLAVQIASFVAEHYQPDLDTLESAKLTAESLAQAREQELIGCRAERDSYVSAISALRGALMGENPNVSAAQSILSTQP